MKLLAISDSHGRLGNSQRVIERLYDRIAGVLHLGDMYGDATLLAANYSDMPFYMVAGNCDFYYGRGEGPPENLVVEIGGQRIFLAHGHRHNIKLHYDALVRDAKKQEARIAVCGHTHEPFCELLNGVYVVNPGSIEYPRGMARCPSYAVIDIAEDGKIEAGIVQEKRGK